MPPSLRKQFVDARGRVRRDAQQDVGEVLHGVDTVRLARPDE